MNDPGLTKILRWATPLLGVVVSAIVYAWLGIELAILVLASFVLLIVIFTLFSSVQALTGEGELSLEDALSMAAPTTEEEQKRAVLRTLKDLEYEKSVGKISEDDYRELVAIYGARAKQLIQAVDEGMEQSRERAERLLDKRLKSTAEPYAKSTRPPEPGTGSEGNETPNNDQSVGSDGLDRSSAAVLRDSISCSECDTNNDTDARFCKGCGRALEAAS